MTSSKSAARNSRYPLGNTDALKTFILVECPFTEPHHTVREGDTLQTLTIFEHAGTVRVPLNQKALDILERYKELEDALLPRFSHFGYNKKIKEILKYVGIDRMVRVLDPKTREDVARPLYEVATTHTARKTFIGNLYKQVKDPNLIASMSGHSEGSRAFARYRKIDDEMKKELVNLLD